MGNYLINEMAQGMGNDEQERIYPKMKVYSEFGYEQVITLIHKMTPAFSKGTIRGVLDTLPEVLGTYLPKGHTLKIDNLGVFSLSLEFADSEAEGENQQEGEKKAKTKYRRVQAKGVNFRVDKHLVRAINDHNTFRQTATKKKSTRSYTLEERLQRALDLIDRKGQMTLNDYASTNNLCRSSASKELAKLSADPHSGIKAKGRGPTKIWVHSEPNS